MMKCKNIRNYLIAPKSYFLLLKREKEIICNGTGSSGTPEWICRGLDDGWGFLISIRPASNIHDYLYWLFCQIKIKIKILYYIISAFLKCIADFIFWINQILIYLYEGFQKPYIKNFISLSYTLPFGIFRATINTLIVLFLGWKAFYKGKNSMENKKLHCIVCDQYFYREEVIADDEGDIIWLICPDKKCGAMITHELKSVNL